MLQNNISSCSDLNFTFLFQNLFIPYYFVLMENLDLRHWNSQQMCDNNIRLFRNRRFWYFGQGPL